ncbi:ribokinase [Pseudogulbenkiania subflava]|uniref:Ribokinase n=1 Tax=Pseudogulbenkiania subflava DSM 22618 TaxID=1123014 RepID=A0A1Y6C6G7_9NEIS|nr:ribokinase [Pseudogulbenkiania subflava]SMF46558.1 ribokinase [Pseudogulbenkiania subflava DSM 22618]
MPKIVVIGSINMDLVALCARFPAPGETLIGERFFTSHGGKGANQAVAARRLGAEVSFIGRVGDDDFGRELLAGLQQEGVNTRHVAVTPGVASGVASITVSGGENAIVVVPGANHVLSPDDVRQAEAEIASADVLLIQLEIPLETVAEVARLAERHGVPLILNPAPAQALPVELLARVAYLTPNQHELMQLLGDTTVSGLESLPVSLAGKVVLTQGAEGAAYADADGRLRHQPGLAVDVVDSTGAGDTFNAALAVFLGLGIEVALKRAVAAGALAVTQPGARGGMPTAVQLDAFLVGSGQR